MEKFKNWLVGLDFSEIDHSVISYTHFLSRIFRPREIEFVHVTEKIPDSVHDHLSQSLPIPGYEELVARMESAVGKIFGDQPGLSFEILDGAVNQELWTETYLKNTDLVIAGHKLPHLGRCLKINKFIHSSFCSVLLVPQRVHSSISKIWVPTDFSSASGNALDQALHLANEVNPPAEVYVHHVFSMPHAYYYQNFPEAEIMNAVKTDAERKCAKFCEKVNTYKLPLISVFTEQTKAYAAEHIKSEAESRQVDLLLIAASGRSKFTKILLGSEVRALVNLHPEIPLLILKDKSSHFRLWELMKL